MCKRQKPSGKNQVSQEFWRKNQNNVRLSNSMVTHTNLIYFELHIGCRNPSLPKTSASTKRKVREKTGHKRMDVKDRLEEKILQ